ncbi:MAG: ABC transporter ATP-binding protein, partial [Ardenticatenaceae bacterium]
LELVGLAGLGGRYPQQLSGGQQQRVAVARALAHEPSVLLLDEPFGALDVKIRGQLRRTLKRIQRQLNVTTILVTHDQEEAFELADRIGVIDHGQLLEVGPPVELYRRPHHPFVAQFVGGATLLAGRWTAGQLRLGSLCLPAPTTPENLPPSGRVAVLLRPEDLVLIPIGEEEDMPVLGRGVIEETHFLGTLQRVQVRLGPMPGIRSLHPDYGEDQIPVQVAHLSSAADAQWAKAPLQVGEHVSVAIRDFHLMARATPHLLLCVDESCDEAYLRQVGEAAGRLMEGPVTTLLVAPREATLRALQTRAQVLLNDIPFLTFKVRVGAVATEILRELQASHYEAAIVSGAASGEIAEVVRRAPVPVLVVKGARDSLRRLLLCTAAGEPGKIDVLLGARLARRAGAAATLLHVAVPTSTFNVQHPTSNVQRLTFNAQPGLTARHLEQGRQTLHHQGVRAEIKVRQGAVVEEILAEAK